MKHYDRVLELDHLADMISMGFFNTEQKQALARVITRSFDEYSTEANKLYWAAHTGDPLIFQEMLNTFSKEELFDTLCRNDPASIIHLLTSAEPQLLHLAFSALPAWQRVALMRLQAHYGKTVLHKAATRIESLHFLLAFLPTDRCLGLILMKDMDGNSVLHKAVENHECLAVLLKHMQKKDLHDALKARNKNGDCALALCLNYPQSLKLLLAAYPEAKRLYAVRTCKPDGTFLSRCLVAIGTGAFKVILSLLPESQRAGFLVETVKEEWTVLQTLVSVRAEISSLDEGFENSFVPDLIAMITSLEQGARQNIVMNGGVFLSPLSRKLSDHLGTYYSFGIIKKTMMSLIEKGGMLSTSLLNTLVPQPYLGDRAEVLKTRWFRMTIISQLTEDIRALPKTAKQRGQLKDILDNLQADKMDFDELKQQVMDISAILRTHKVTGCFGFFKGHCGRVGINHDHWNVIYDFMSTPSRNPH